jgi:probable O-glycosylation ligase (exosortase A-associated)
MRGLVVSLIIFGLLPMAMVRPFIGALLWAWVGMMYPHRLTWGFAYDMPFAQLIALATIFGFIISSERKKLPMDATVITILVFMGWMTVTTLFAHYQDLAWEQWNKVLKILFMLFLSMAITYGRQRIVLLTTVVALSLGFYGVKGGIFTILSGGSQHVLGPPGSFFQGNNEMGLVLVMTMPLLFFVRAQTKRPLFRWALLGAILTTAVAILGTQSRGAFLGIVAMSTVLWWRSERKMLFLLALIVIVPLLLYFMADSWFERMGTITEYDKDASAMGRINAWWTAWGIATHHFFGGGYNALHRPDFFHLYAPNPADTHVAHSIYFQVLAHHGFVGLAIFITLLVTGFRNVGWIIRNAKGHEPLKWALDLAKMLQVSLVGYMVSGAFLSLAYFDLYYYILALSVLTKVEVAEYLKNPALSAEEERPGGHPNRRGSATGPPRPGKVRSPIRKKRPGIRPEGDHA